MYTRCPACHAVHSVSAALLAAAGGDYRCARCSKVNNALECLFDELPAAGDRPPDPRLELDPTRHPVRELDGEELDPILALLLGPVHGCISIFNETFRILSVIRINRDTYTGINKNFLSCNMKGLLKNMKQRTG